MPFLPPQSDLLGISGKKASKDILRRTRIYSTEERMDIGGFDNQVLGGLLGEPEPIEGSISVNEQRSIMWHKVSVRGRARSRFQFLKGFPKGGPKNRTSCTSSAKNLRP